MANRKFLVAESGPDGSPGAPTYSFSNAATTGMYYPGSNGLGLSTNGGARLTIDATGIVTLTSTGQAVASSGFIDITRTTAASAALRTFVTADTTERLQIRQDGQLIWGPGNATGDTNLYRSGIGVLTTDDQFVAAGLSVGTSVLSADELLHTSKTWTIDDGGTKLTNYFQSTMAPTGSGGVGGDLAATAYAGYFEHHVNDATATGNITGVQIALRAITLANNNAATPRTLSSVNAIWADTNFSGAGTFGNVSSAIGLRCLATTPGSGVWADRRGVWVNNATVTAGGSLTNQYGLFVDSLTSGGTGNFAIYLAGALGTPANGITWNGDTNLYRSAANFLATDDALQVLGGQVFIQSSGFGFIDVADTAGGTNTKHFRMMSAGGFTSFQTVNDAYTVGTSVLEVNNSTGKLLLGSGRDNANLYRGGTNLVETDGSLQVNGNVGFNGKTPVAPADFTTIYSIKINNTFPSTGSGLIFSNGAQFPAGGGGMTFVAGSGIFLGQSARLVDRIPSMPLSDLSKVVISLITNLQAIGVLV